jgi:hypothetical protein
MMTKIRRVYRTRDWSEWLLLFICAISMAFSIFLLVFGRGRMKTWEGPFPPPGSGQSNGGAGLETLLASIEEPSGKTGLRWGLHFFTTRYDHALGRRDRTREEFCSPQDFRGRVTIEAA